MTAQLLAPFMPFLSEAIYRNLAAGEAGVPESVRLSDWPVAPADWSDDELRRQMPAVRRLVAGGLAARNAAGIKVRQPLRSVTIAERPLSRDLEAILLEELNIKAARYQGDGGGLNLHTQISGGLKLEGPARGLVSKIQEGRK